MTIKPPPSNLAVRHGEQGQASAQALNTSETGYAMVSEVVGSQASGHAASGSVFSGRVGGGRFLHQHPFGYAADRTVPRCKHHGLAL
ncbi:hypothetical protein RB25_20000 [Herbaspirillum rubrisubalbicans]|uniref:hypothetical protein n=1 Tax=Herbaspirillum rubrisubalbicans TaxID=80842 RepID=UPI0002EC45FA|nr:hypothetical protein [Herbaspirillum rubrisubalbicans]RAN44823.1 hypothetical protein RB25_20000 [Herbaspirillum rubrisubalbicans]